MDIVKLVATALQPIADSGIQVAQGWYDENLNKTHISIFLLYDRVEEYSDDEPELIGNTVQINIWGIKDEVKLKRKVFKLMKKNDFLYLEGQDNYEQKGSKTIYNKAMRFKYLEDYEEDEE